MSFSTLTARNCANDHFASLIPKNNKPLFAFSTSSSSALPSALDHLTSGPSSSAFLPERIAFSNPLLRRFRAAIRRGSECPVKMMSAVRGGSASYSFFSCVSRVDKTAWTSSSDGWTGGTAIVPSAATSPLDLFVIPVIISVSQVHEKNELTYNQVHLPTQ